MVSRLADAGKKQAYTKSFGISSKCNFLIILALFLCAGLFSPAAALAVTYYVGPDGTNSPGNGTGPGTAAWKTMHYAFNNLTSNSTLIVEGGTYSVGNGETDNPLTVNTLSNVVIKGDGPAVIDGTGAVSTWVDGITVSGTAVNITIENLTIKNFTDGVIDQGTGTRIERNQIQNCTNGITVAPSATPKIINNLIFGHVLGIDYTGGNGAQIFHNTIDLCSDKGIKLNGSFTMEISYNIITNYLNWGIWASGTGPTLSYNNLYSITGAPYNNVTGGTGAISEDPLYIGAGDYHLQEISPCLDKIPASPVNIDKDGYTRPQWPSYDMGCYERLVGQHTVSVTLSPGSTAADYKLVAMPVGAENASAVSVIGPQIGTYDTTKMRLGRWKTSLAAYEEYPGFGNIYPADSFWVLFREGKTLNFVGYPAPKMTLSGYSGVYTQVPLHEGWNMVGNPFHDIAINVGDIVVEDASPTVTRELLTAGTITQGVVWVYSNGAYSQKTGGDPLAVAEGCWVKKESAYPGDGYIYFRDQEFGSDNRPVTVYAPAAGTADAPDMPPLPPTGGLSNESSGESGGGGGGCFIGALLD